LLLNVALHGMEEAAGVLTRRSGSHAGQTIKGSPVVVRYADLCGCRHKSAYAEFRIMPRIERTGGVWPAEGAWGC
jgi:RNA-directed DNA polymerase